MSPSEVEKIGLVRQADDAPEQASAGPARLGDRTSFPDPQPNRLATAPGKQPPQTRRVHPILALLLLLALAGTALALANQIERTEQLETHVGFLSGELDRARDDLAAREHQMAGVRSAVADLTERMSALRTLVDQPRGAAQP